MSALPPTARRRARPRRRSGDARRAVRGDRAAPHRAVRPRETAAGCGAGVRAPVGRRACERDRRAAPGATGTIRQYPPRLLVVAACGVPVANTATARLRRRRRAYTLEALGLDSTGRWNRRGPSRTSHASFAGSTTLDGPDHADPEARPPDDSSPMGPLANPAGVGASRSASRGRPTCRSTPGARPARHRSFVRRSGDEA